MNQIEQEYRDALDGLRFSGAGKERIMNKLTEQNGQSAEKRRAFRTLRPALIAAVLCLALVGTVFAAGWDLAAFVRRDVSSDGGEIFRIDGNSLARYSWADLAVEYEDGRIDSNHSSWEAAEQYLGLEMPMSRTLVEKWSPQTFDVYGFDSGGDSETYDCRVAITDECIMTDAVYRMEQWYTCAVSSYVLTDTAEPDCAPPWIVGTGDAFSAAYEKYVTPGGLETGIISGQNAYWGVFVRDGIGYYVWLSWSNTPIDDLPESQSHGLELFKQVLDGFAVTE